MGDETVKGHIVFGKDKNPELINQLPIKRLVGRHEFEAQLDAFPYKNQIDYCDHMPTSNSYCEYQLEMVSTFLPTPIAEYIIERFCEDLDVETYRKIDFDQPCQQCISKQKRILKREYLEKQLVLQHENIETDSYFLIPADWIVKWNLHLCHSSDDDKFMNTYFFDSFETPPEIDNELLLEQGEPESKLRQDLQVGRDYMFVNNRIMQMFVILYGCKNIVGRQEKDIQSSEAAYTGDYVDYFIISAYRRPKASGDSTSRYGKRRLSNQ